MEYVTVWISGFWCETHVIVHPKGLNKLICAISFLETVKYFAESLNGIENKLHIYLPYYSFEEHLFDDVGGNSFESRNGQQHFAKTCRIVGMWLCGVLRKCKLCLVLKSFNLVSPHKVTLTIWRVSKHSQLYSLRKCIKNLSPVGTQTISGLHGMKQC